MASHVIYIRRMWQTNKSTISVFNVSDSSIKGYFLERPGPDTTQSNQNKRIPEGEYKIKWHNSSISGVIPHNPVPILYNSSVPLSRYILIHNGNLPIHSKGCLLIGSSKGIDIVGGSVLKLIELKKFIKDEDIENFTITITSCYTGCRE
ncbi:DUF5675 family protein [Pectobacterium parmentieri]|uniref:DUF5675 domain-containing protein n=1 Tax=Pectobacterium parmentieri TaxID=1905730 RepID=A0A0H3I5J3_PECPM|nr:DUF5675 family protein [Pectobacterium parmentieri]ACX88219.1 hypothetical protein Pecwa_2458 [Pectobacterium parmentieri WPP163]AFI90519.1 Hypothetical protein W5S_2431 [Pectobacterium parmentieri]AOR58528.1 hypothetical protein A8F97_06360 [Pectobacterium parmentieri]AYH05915.1 hypothetical protein C5E25_11435 [Pectobacterium parmentieri]AYH10469.1 hypothetical protein C5E24_12640 [Pectobacterium parmentieri]